MLNEMCLISHIFYNAMKLFTWFAFFSFPLIAFHLFACVLTDIP